jgi:HEPN domain-containing protein
MFSHYLTRGDGRASTWNDCQEIRVQLSLITAPIHLVAELTLTARNLEEVRGDALAPAMMQEHAAGYFVVWKYSANEFFIDAGNAINRGGNKNAVFYLHQSAERYIPCLLLVQTGYRPKEHAMEKLLRQAAGIDPRYDSIIPNNIKEEKNLFELLRRAYVNSRYGKKLPHHGKRTHRRRRTDRTTQSRHRRCMLKKWRY